MARDEIPVEMSQKILENVKKKTRKSWESIASFVGVVNSTISRIRNGEIGLSFQQLLDLVERMGPDVLSTLEDASPEVKELYEAYRRVILE